MKIVKTVGKCFFWLLMAALLMAPVALIFQLSEAEMAEYKPAPPPVILESAYGDTKVAYRGDIAEYTTVSGTYVCREYGYMELSYEDPGRIRWEVGTGDLIAEGQVLGSYQGEDVVSEISGRITQMQTYGEEPYIQVQLLSPVELECAVTDPVLRILERSSAVLTGEDGTAVTVTYKAPVKEPDGTTLVRLRLGDGPGVCGQAVENYPIYTGRVYTETLLLDVDCVYQKEPGDGNPWFARKVSADGIFIQELEVQVGYSDGNVVCVTGVEPGDYFDSGYKYVVGGVS